MPAKSIHEEVRGAIYSPVGQSLFKLTLSRSNKAEIFEHGLSKLAQAQREASLILNNLKKWNPSVASLFMQRSAETTLDTPFRLIFPNDALSSFDETGFYVRQYIAVSYCWVSDEFMPDGYERHADWPISKPFVDAILGDKDHPREGIWMDQLCIDQDSSQDKQASVAAMDVIYKSCIRMVILLEDVHLNEREASLHEKYDPTKRTFDRVWTPDEEDRKAFVEFSVKVNKARWWERAWCFHEFNVNEPWSDKRQCNMIHNATFVVNGPAGTTVKIKWVNLQLIMGSALYLLPNSAEGLLSDFKGQAIFTGVERGENHESELRSSLMARHNGVGMMGCRFLADKISVMINMAGLGLAYMGPDLHSKEDVLYVAALLSLAAGEVYPLSMFDGKLVELDGAPTWLVRSSVPEDTTIPKFKVGSVRGIHRISTSEIELDMVFFNTNWEPIIDTTLAPTSTYRIFPDTIPTTQPETHVPETYLQARTTVHKDEVLDPLRRRFLAACISNGYSFTARLWAQLKRDVVEVNWNTGVFKDMAPNPFLHKSALELIAQLLPVSTLLGICSPSESFGVEDAHMFLTWITDQRSTYYIGAFSRRVRSTRDGDQALITSMSFNEHFNVGPADEVRVAVPTDMLGIGCIPMRVWILRPIKDEKDKGKWRLVGKALLLGESNLLGEARRSEGREAAVVSLRRMVVTG